MEAALQVRGSARAPVTTLWADNPNPEEREHVLNQIGRYCGAGQTMLCACERLPQEGRVGQPSKARWGAHSVETGMHVWEGARHVSY